MIAHPADALAYALSRMPATYAAVARVIADLAERLPDFSPASTLDLGAGPGTASWAVMERWPALQSARLLDHNLHLLALARTLARGDERVRVEAGDATGPGETAELVMAAYAFTELSEARLRHAARAAWDRSTGVLVIVEPGTPLAYGRLMSVRAELIAAGATIVGPCPHQAPCPLVRPDWCHFAVRLPRSRDHRVLKGADAPYEDEKFSYVIAARGGKPAGARVIKPVIESKAATVLELCTPGGIERLAVASRDKAKIRAVRRLRWGDPIADPRGAG